MAGHLPKRVETFIDPLSGAVVPLVDGLARHALPRMGAFEHSRYINGTITHYYAIPCRRASHVPVLFVHGLGDNAVTWSLVAPLVAQRHDAYMVDLPGYGLSSLPSNHTYTTINEMADLLAAFIQDVIGRPALVAGNSMGGWIAVRLAELRPELVRGVMLINPGGALLDGHDSWDAFIASLSPADAHQAREVARHVFGFLPPPFKALSARGVLNLFARQIVREFISATDEPDFLSAAELRQLQTPTALLWGARDRFLPPGSFEFFRDHLPNPAIRVIRFCGHLPQRERPLATARFIRRFAHMLA